MAQNNWIAIDLGTTNSCASVWKDGRVEVIPISHGKRILASAVRFEPELRAGRRVMTIGDIAKDKRFKFHQQTVTDAKRVIGRLGGDAEVMGEMRVQACLKTEAGKPVYRIGAQRYSPEEVGSFVIGELKRCAEAYLGHPVTDAVITCPAYFNDSQRRATREAGRLAGLNVLRIINEPTAAALAWSYQDREKGRRRSVHLVFDCGGGTTDVSIIDVNNGAHRVIASVGDMHCGGNDLDESLAHWLLNELRRKYKTDWIGKQDKWPAVIAACEKAKIDLSKAEETDIIVNGVDAEITLQREDFLDICRPILTRMFAPINTALAHARLNATNIDSVILVGGTTFIPAIQEGLRARLPAARIEETVDKDTAVAFGAGVQAALIKGLITPAQMSLSDIVPHSLSFEDYEGNSIKVIEVGRTLPARNTRGTQTPVDNLTAMNYPIYEGEDPVARNNHRLGQLLLTGLPPRPKGEVRADVTFEVDYDGILVVTVVMTHPTQGQPITASIQTG